MLGYGRDPGPSSTFVSICGISCDKGKLFYGHKTLIEVSLWQLLLGEKEVVFQGMFHFAAMKRVTTTPHSFFYFSCIFPCADH